LLAHIYASGMEILSAGLNRKLLSLYHLEENKSEYSFGWLTEL